MIYKYSTNEKTSRFMRKIKVILRRFNIPVKLIINLLGNIITNYYCQRF